MRLAGSKNNDVLYPVVLMFAGAFFLYHLAACRGVFIDDAFISFRYAANLAAGHGLRFNSGSDTPVEGFSNFLWVVLLAGADLVGISETIAAKVLGTLSAAGIALCLLLWIKKRNRGLKASDYLPVVVIIPLAHYGMAYWAMAGLETVFFSFLLLCAVLRTFDGQENIRPHAGFIFALVALCRPEGALYFLITFVFGILLARRFAARQLLFLAAFAALYLPFLLFRHHYYGSWLPNTYYAKVGGFSWGTLRLGFFYILEFLRENLLTASALSVSIIAFIRWRKRYDPVFRLTFWILLGQMAFVVRVGGDWMPNSRFLLPAVPLVAILSAGALRRLQDTSLMKNPLRPAWALSGILLVLLYSGEWLYTPHMADDQRSARQLLEAHGSLASWLKKNSSPRESIALGDIGIISYRTGLRIIDAIGLANSRVAGLKREKKYDAVAKYVLDQEPDWIVLVSSVDPEKHIYWMRTDGLDALYNAPRFLTRYRYLRSWCLNEHYYLMLFERSNEEKAFVIKPAMAPGYYRLYEWAKRRNLFPLARKALGAVAQIHQNYPDFLNFELVYRDVDSGEVTRRQKLSPSYLSKKHIQSEMLTMLGRTKEAEETVLQNLEENPGDPGLLIRAGDFYMQERREAKARDLYQEALRVLEESDDKNPQRIVRLAYLNSQLGDYETSTALYEEIIRLFPNEPRLYMELALVQRKRGDEKSAIEMLEKACSLEGTPENAYIYLSRLYENSGRFQKAIKSLQHCLVINPEFPTARLALARLYSTLPGMKDSIAFHLRYIRKNNPYFASNPDFREFEKEFSAGGAP